MKLIIKNLLNSLISKIYKRVYKNNNRVICLHETPDRKLLKSKLMFLQKKFEIVSLDDLLEKNSSSHLKNRVAITLDDGFKNWYEIALPIFIELNVPFTIFICSGILKLSELNKKNYVANRLLRKSNLNLLDKYDLLELNKSELVTIGSHTFNHTKLSSIEELEAIKMLKTEREFFKKLLGKTIKYFAYPFGTIDSLHPNSELICHESGFEAAFTTIPSRVKFPKFRFLIGRSCLDLHQKESYWESCLNGGNDMIYKIINVILKNNLKKIRKQFKFFS